ncbi:MAG: hypothetical protein HYU41_11055 [Candidatus Rokubacteria bacterium]|nr:hypothetical protein [Candidatus Rokubacteria bacterium]
MTKALTTLGLVLIFVATAVAQPSRGTAATSVTRLHVNEGSVLHGAITGGTVIVKTTFGGEIRIDPRRIQSLVGTTLTLDDGSVVHGTIGAGQVTLASAFGTLSVPAERVTEIQHVRPGTAVSSAPGRQPAPAAPATPATPAAPGAPTATPPPATTTKAIAAPPKITTANVKFVNDTRRNLNVCVNDETPCLPLGPQGTTSRTMPLGPLRLRVESTTQLGFVVLATGSFQKSLQVAEAETVVRVTEDDFR